VISAESLINAPAAWKYKKKMKRNSNSWRPLPFFLPLSLSPSFECSKNKIIKVENSLSGLKKNNRKKSSKCLKNNNKKEGGQKANYTNNGEQF